MICGAIIAFGALLSLTVGDDPSATTVEDLRREAEATEAPTTRPPTTPPSSNAPVANPPAATAPPETAPPTTAPPTSAAPAIVVTDVVDGDTIDTTSGAVRIIGIDTPERGACNAGGATDHALALTPVGSIVTLTAVPGHDDTDRYGRLLRYVTTAEGLDFGGEQLKFGWAEARYDSLDGYGAHPKEDDYRALDAATEAPACPLPPSPPPAPGPSPGPDQMPTSEPCTPGYDPCLAPASDYDCAGGSGDGPAYTGYVRVTGSDPYDLDRDGDGAGCE